MAATEGTSLNHRIYCVTTKDFATYAHQAVLTAGSARSTRYRPGRLEVHHVHQGRDTQVPQAKNIHIAPPTRR
jgi:hypothetical protein